jgi:hypothetical protein
MSIPNATAEGYLALLKALPKRERDAIVARIARDRQLVQDIFDLATIERRLKEPSRSFRDYLNQKQNR